MKSVKRTKRIAQLSAIGAAAALVLSACGGGDKPAEEIVESDGDETEAVELDKDGCVMAEEFDFMVPTYSDNTKALWEEVIEGFEAENPGTKVNLEVQSWENINDVVRTKVQSDQMPDLLNIDAFAGYVDDEMLYPVNEVMSPETISDFQDSFVANASMAGEQWGIPLIASARALFYNKTLFEEAGLDPEKPPTTWDELWEDATKITEIDGVYGYGLPLGNEEAQAETAVWIFGNGGSYGDDQELTIVTPENVEAVDYFKSLYEAGLTQPDAGSSQRTPLQDVFIQGKIGMIVGLPPIVGMIEEKNPDLDYGIAPLPTKDGSPVTLGVADHMMAFDNGDDEKRCAVKGFLDYFYQPDVYSHWVETEGFLPVTKTGAEKLGDQEDLKIFIDLLPDAKFYPSTNPNWSATQGAIQTLIGQVAQGKDAEDVLVEINEKAQ